MNDRREMENTIENTDVLNTLVRYRALTDIKLPSFSTEYYKRKENFGSYIFDHLFLVLTHKLEFINEESEIFKGFKKAITQGHTDYKTVVSTNKTKLSLSTRNYKITNFYNVIFYESIVSKMLNYLKLSFEYDKEKQENDLFKLLVDGKYFGFAHKINFLEDSYKVENYINGWLEFEKEKLELKSTNQYFLDFDITDFYDSIDHKLFIDLLKDFFDRYSNFFGVEKFLLTFNDSLFKVNGYEKKGLPQGLLGSDILSTIFLWLLINKNTELLQVKNDNGIYKSTQFDIKFLFYADDFIIFGNDLDKINKFFNNNLKRLFNTHGLSLHGTNNLISPFKKEFYPSETIDFDKIKEKNEVEIEKLLQLFISEISKEDLNKIEFWKLKKYYNWIFILNTLTEIKKVKYLKEIKKIIFKNIDLRKSRIIFSLQSISVKNYIFLIEELLKKNLIKEKDIVELYRQYGYLLSEGTLEIFHIFAENHPKIWKLDNKLRSLKLSREFITGLNNRYLLKREVRRQGLQTLEKFMYGNIGDSYEENILGIKLFSLFSIDKNKVNGLSGYIFKQFKNNNILFNHLNRLAFDLTRITDNLILIKNIKPFFFLEDASFIADLYSLFNALLSLWISINKSDCVESTILGNELKNIGKIKINGGIELLSGLDKNTEDIKYLLFYITKLRAELNHKEKNTKWKSSINVFIRYKEPTFFSYSIKEAIDIIFSLIEKEIYNN